MKLLNATMHDQSAHLEAFAALGLEVEATPSLRVHTSPPGAYELASEVTTAASREGFDGLLIGGRTDVMIYIALSVAWSKLKLFIAETERIRDENDRFVFNLVGVTPVCLKSSTDYYPHVVIDAVAMRDA